VSRLKIFERLVLGFLTVARGFPTLVQEPCREREGGEGEEAEESHLVKDLKSMVLEIVLITSTTEIRAPPTFSQGGASDLIVAGLYSEFALRKLL